MERADLTGKFAIVAYVFGENYQAFAPYYAYSILRAYPDYSVLLYFDREVPPETRSAIVALKSVGDVRFRESYDFGMPIGTKVASGSNVQRAGRWLFQDEWFTDFEWLYIGDVDMLIFSEEVALLEGHQRHAMSLGLPYSNMIRLSVDPQLLTPGAVKNLLAARDYRTLIDRLKGRAIVRHRLTGLHFVERLPYYEAVVPLFSQLISEIRGDSADVRSRDDEELLYQLVERSSLGLPPVSATGPDLDSRNFAAVNFRPHHGLHLGIFRSSGSIARQRQTLESYVYQDYYRDYKELRQDEFFLSLERQSNPYVRSLFDALNRYLAQRS